MAFFISFEGKWAGARADINVGRSGVAWTGLGAMNLKQQQHGCLGDTIGPMLILALSSSSNDDERCLPSLYHQPTKQPPFLLSVCGFRSPRARELLQIKSKISAAARSN